jgi:uncharacterized membrane protein YccC
MKKSSDTDGKKFHKYKKKKHKRRLQHLLIDSVSVLNWLMSNESKESRKYTEILFGIQF